MLTEKNFKNIVTIALIVILLILGAIVLKPIIFPIIFGILLAFVLYPVYQWLLKKIKNENLAALSVCIGSLILIIAIAILTLGALINQAVNFYIVLQDFNFADTVNRIIPFLSESEFSTQVTSSFNSFIKEIVRSAISNATDFIINIPKYLLKLFIAIFVFFFALRDGKKLVEYIKSLSPLEKETEKQFFKHFKDVTYAVLVGQVVIGIVQGAIAGIGYFVLGINNSLLLMFLTIIASMIPMLGPWLVWVPVDIYLFAGGRTGAGIALLIYGLVIVSLIDNFLRPIIVSRKAKINPAIVIIGMIGGLFVFGILGLILGPLILAYILLIIEIYRKSKIDESILFAKKEERQPLKKRLQSKLI